MRGRGLKQAIDGYKWKSSQSPPMRGRGLKHRNADRQCAIVVAPHAGAWIETYEDNSEQILIEVAPHAGAWIETFQGEDTLTILMSPPMRGRGLKHVTSGGIFWDKGRPPCGGVD